MLGWHLSPALELNSWTAKHVYIYVYIYIYIYVFRGRSPQKSLSCIYIKSRRLRWAGHVARMEEGRSAFKILTGKPTGKRLLGKPRRRWEDNIRMDLEEIGVSAGNWVDTAQDRNYWRALVNLRCP